MTYAGVSWREGGNLAEMGAVLTVMRQLHEMLVHLDEVGRRSPDPDVAAVRARIEELTTADPETLLTAASLVRPGGTIANVGVHGTPVELPMQDMWIKNVTLTMGLVDTVSIPILLKMVASGRIPAEKMGTHRFTFDQWEEAYDTFSRAADEHALKVIVTA